ncbi:response regulator transcription factor [Paenibacillus sp. P96]|uniref:Response regulator transcription factor n=1 Tax=Paenibacillus zeirhizosphaerae TaxID=2987519 RepID=A0ABT9FVA7_9BACL|nr:response regulator transcription factor [Paenibacillus sp. P96]MDP4098635.1 response regulator transcription factor [Paenibacillus sp. P96]
MEERILLVGGKSREHIRKGLEEAGYRVIYLHNAQEAAENVEDLEFDLLLLDADLPPLEANRLLNGMDEENKRIPVMMITDSEAVDKVVECFDRGAHDVVMAEVPAQVLHARIKNLLLIFRGTLQLNSRIKVADLVIDRGARKVRRGDGHIGLTTKEFDLLWYLALHVNQACSRQRILKHVWRHEYIADTNVVDVYIRHLRLKVDHGHKYKLIRTIRGVGYLLQEPPADASDSTT